MPDQPNDAAPQPAFDSPKRSASAVSHAARVQVVTRLDAAIDWCAKGISWLVFIAMGISVFEVISRYLFNSPTSWVHETTVFMIAVLFALGGPVALAHDKHIRVRLIYDWISPEKRRWLELFNNIVGLGFCAGMSYAAYVLFWRSAHSPLGDWQLERSGTSWNPPFPALTKGIIMVALLLMTAQVVLHIVHSLRHWKHPVAGR